MTTPTVTGRTLRVIVLSDTHLGFDMPIRPRTERRRRGPDFDASFARVLAFARAHADAVVHTGDVFFRSRVSPLVYDAAYARLVELADAGIAVAIVPGNHDRSTLPPSLYLGHPGIHVFDVPACRQLTTRGGAVWLSAFPHQREIRRGFAALVRAVRPPPDAAGVRLLCFHQSVAGAVVGPAGFKFRDAPDVICRRDVPTGFHAVISGHIHRHQILDCGGAQVLFPGSTERTSFAEEDETKGFLDLVFAEAAGQWVLRERVFRALPTRPMTTFEVDGCASIRSVGLSLAAFVRGADPNAILRLRWRTAPSADQRQWLSSARRRKLFPASMNVELAGFHRR